jgi:hypothetical protein
MPNSTDPAAAEKRKKFEAMNLLGDQEIEADLAIKTQGKFAFPKKAADVEHKNIEWLWNGFLPLGTLSLLYGTEGSGKSVLTAMLAAQASRGLLPGKLFGTPVGVEMFAFEDDHQAVLKPRLEAAGADLDRCYFHADDLAEQPLVLPDDVPALTAALIDRGSKLVIIDPLTDTLRDGLKENSNNDVRKALVPLLKAAEAAGACILGVTHPNKGATEAANKVMGSKAWRSVPRSVMIYGPNPADPAGDTRVLALSKINLARKQAVEVKVGEVAVDGLDDLQPKAELKGVSNYTDQDVIAARGGGTIERNETKNDRAKHLLFALLEDGGGEIDAKAAIAAGLAQDLSEPTMKRARQDIGATPGRVWTLPASGLTV